MTDQACIDAQYEVYITLIWQLPSFRFNDAFERPKDPRLISTQIQGVQTDYRVCRLTSDNS